MPEIVQVGSPILEKECKPFDFELKEHASLKESLPEEDWNSYKLEYPVELAKTLGEIMINQGGVGLSAPQVDMDIQVFVFGDPTNKESIHAVFNPEIVFFSEEKNLAKEGCLSFPYIYPKIWRSNEIRMRYTNMHGERMTEKFSGFTARVIQHEFDHLMGVTFDKKVKPYHWQQAKRKAKIYERRAKDAWRAERARQLSERDQQKTVDGEESS